MLDSSISGHGKRPKQGLIYTSEINSLGYSKKPSLADILSSSLPFWFSPQPESRCLVSGGVVLQSGDLWMTEQQSCQHVVEMREVWRSEVRYRLGCRGARGKKTPDHPELHGSRMFLSLCLLLVRFSAQHNLICSCWDALSSPNPWVFWVGEVDGCFWKGSCMDLVL